MPVTTADTTATTDAADGPTVDTSDDNSSAHCWPPCLVALKERCGRPLVGTCVKQDLSFCYSNGIKEVIVNGDGGTSFAFYNAGVLCASVSLVGGTYVYRDGAGTMVATLTEKTAGDPYSDTTVACDGNEVVVSGATLQSASCKTIHEGDCTVGVCQ